MYPLCIGNGTRVEHLEKCFCFYFYFITCHKNGFWLLKCSLHTAYSIVYLYWYDSRYWGHKYTYCINIHKGTYIADGDVHVSRIWK